MNGWNVSNLWKINLWFLPNNLTNVFINFNFVKHTRSSIIARKLRNVVVSVICGIIMLIQAENLFAKSILVLNLINEANYIGILNHRLLSMLNEWDTVVKREFSMFFNVFIRTMNNRGGMKTLSPSHNIPLGKSSSVEYCLFSRHTTIYFKIRILIISK